jgi:RNA polymerase sigma-70 factor (ECF subfamily)
LYGIAKNTIYNYYRKKKTKKIFNFFLDEEKNENQPDISSEKYSPETDIIDKELTDKVKEAIQNLSVKYRTAIVLYTYENKSYKEISKIMGKSISAVESLIFRAREKLKKSLQDYIEN